MSSEQEGTESTALPQGIWKTIRPFDALLFAVFVFDRVALAGILPFGVLWSGFIILVGITRRPVYKIRYHGILLIIFIMILMWLGVTSAYNGVDFSQRLLRITLLFALLSLLMEGRFHWFSAIAGLGGALLLFNLPMYYLGLTSDNYPPFLTGFIGDKNVSGLWYAVVTILGLWVFRSRGTRVTWLVAMGTAVFLTGSRTSISGVAVALTWFFFRNKISWFFRVLLGSGLLAGLLYAEEELARIGVFADREGTDSFRERIQVFTEAKLALTPWYGQGLTTSFVTLDRGETFLFHDSFAALRVEGGLPLLMAMITLFLLIGAGLLDTKNHVPLRVRIGEAACLVVLVCAWKMGEVFFTTISFTALSFAFWARFAEPADGISPRAFLDLARRPLPVDPADPAAPIHREALLSPMVAKGTHARA